MGINTIDETLGQWLANQILLEGGAYGHMSHPFDDKGLTFISTRKFRFRKSSNRKNRRTKSFCYLEEWPKGSKKYR